ERAEFAFGIEVTGGNSLDTRIEFSERRLVDRLQQRLLALRVPIQRAGAHPGGLGKVTNGDCVVSALIEESRRDSQDFASPLIALRFSGHCSRRTSSSDYRNLTPPAIGPNSSGRRTSL